ncbi:MAG TPA: AraC family transcriptional regulator [Pseudogulbenkiania sp.]|nr:AraC family transcriptional regulator [Pseudogulbenkiania sp.]
MNSDAKPLFWRDPGLPFLELRTIQDGRQVCYARHSHEHFSIGAITGGCSTYLSEQTSHAVGRGDVVLMNPGEVHACNPIGDQPWSYHMLYVDTAWLAGLQRELGLSANQDFHPFQSRLSQDARLYRQLGRLVALCRDGKSTALQKQGEAVAFFSAVQSLLQPTGWSVSESHAKLQQAADFINDHYAAELSLQDISTAASLSSSYLIRAFRQRYHMTPHEYLLNCRIQRGKALLRRGHGIADVAQALGFADQAHFQRIFKRLVAATPGQYRRARG